MIVLDEQLLGRNLEREIAKWYRGKVLFVTDLRMGKVIRVADEKTTYYTFYDRQIKIVR